MKIYFRYIVLFILLAKSAELYCQMPQSLIFQEKPYKVFPLEYSNFNWVDQEDLTSYDIPPITTMPEDGDYVYLYANYTPYRRHNYNSKDSTKYKNEVFASFSIINRKINGPAKFYSNANVHENGIKLLLFECNYINNLKSGPFKNYNYTKFGNLNDMSSGTFKNGLLDGPYTRTNRNEEQVESGFIKLGKPSGLWQRKCEHGIRLENFDTHFIKDSFFQTSQKTKLSKDSFDEMYLKMLFENECHISLNELINTDSFILVIQGHNYYPNAENSEIEVIKLYAKYPLKLLIQINNQEYSHTNKIQQVMKVYPVDFIPTLKAYHSIFDKYLRNNSKILYYSKNTGFYKKIDLGALSADLPLRNYKLRWKDFKQFYLNDEPLEADAWNDSLVNIAVVTNNLSKTLKITATCGSVRLMDHNYMENAHAYLCYFKKDLLNFTDSTKDLITPIYRTEYNNLMEKVKFKNKNIFTDSVVTTQGNNRSVTYSISLIQFNQWDRLKYFNLLSSEDLEKLKSAGISNPIIFSDDKTLQVFKFNEVLDYITPVFTISYLDTEFYDLGSIYRDDESLIRENSYKNDEIFPNLNNLEEIKPYRYFLNNTVFNGLLQKEHIDSIVIKKVLAPEGTLLFESRDTIHSKENFLYLSKLNNRKFIYPFKNGYLNGIISINDIEMERKVNAKISMKNGMLDGPSIIEEDTQLLFQKLDFAESGRMILKAVAENDIDVDKISDEDSAKIITTIQKYFLTYYNNKELIYKKEINFKDNKKSGLSSHYGKLKDGRKIIMRVNFENGIPEGDMDLLYMKCKNQNGVPEGTMYFYDSSLTTILDSVVIHYYVLNGHIIVNANGNQHLKGDGIDIINNQLSGKSLEFYTGDKRIHSIIPDTSLAFILMNNPNEDDDYIEYPKQENINFIKIQYLNYSTFNKRNNYSFNNNSNFASFTPFIIPHVYKGIPVDHLEFYPGHHRWEYPNGKTALHGQVNHLANLNGNWKYYYMNGALMFLTNYDQFCMEYSNRACKPQLISVYDSAGKYYAKIQFNELEFDGSCESHQLMPDGEFDVLDWPKNHTDAAGNYFFRLYHENGIVKWEENIQANGSKTGVWKKYNRSGLPIEIGQYKNNIKEGQWVSGDLSTYSNLDNLCYLDSASLRAASNQLHFTITNYSLGTEINKHTFYSSKSEGKTENTKRRYRDTFQSEIYTILEKYLPAYDRRGHYNYQYIAFPKEGNSAYYEMNQYNLYPDSYFMNKSSLLSTR